MPVTTPAVQTMERTVESPHGFRQRSVQLCEGDDARSGGWENRRNRELIQQERTEQCMVDEIVGVSFPQVEGQIVEVVKMIPREWVSSACGGDSVGAERANPGVHPWKRVNKKEGRQKRVKSRRRR